MRLTQQQKGNVFHSGEEKKEGRKREKGRGGESREGELFPYSSPSSPMTSYAGKEE